MNEVVKEYARLKAEFQLALLHNVFEAVNTANSPYHYSRLGADNR